MNRGKKPKSMVFQAILVSILLIIAHFPLGALRAEGAENPADIAMVWVVDASGSMEVSDPQRYWTEAVSLGVDLAPTRTEAAYIAINSTVLAHAPLADVTSLANRDSFKASVRGTVCQAYTDFSLGIDEAIGVMDSSGAEDKRIFLIGDIGESGFMFPGGGYGHVAGKMADITARCVEKGIEVHLLFIAAPVQNGQFMPLWEALAEQSGGSLSYIEEPYGLIKAVETNFFREFAYNSSVSTVANTADAWQDVRIKLPAFSPERVKVYASPSDALTGLKFNTDEVQAYYADSRFYALAELAGDIPQTITLTLPPGNGTDTRVYLLVDGGITFTPKVESRIEGDGKQEEYRQVTTLALSADRKISGTPGTDFDVQITLKDAQGGIVAPEQIQFADNVFFFDFYPQEFGTYEITLSLNFQGVSVSADTVVVIERIELPEPRRIGSFFTDYAIWIAIIAGVLLILAACIFAIVYRRRQRAQTYVPPVSQSSYAGVYAGPEGTGTFTGKLDIYGVLIQGGAAEIPASSLRLDRFAGYKSITLHRAFEAAGIPFSYQEADRIFLVPEQDNKLLVKNQSNAIIHSGGQPRYKGQQAVLLFGQKMTVTFEDEVNEYEIYFHNTLDKANAGKDIHLELQDQ